MKKIIFLVACFSIFANQVLFSAGSDSSDDIIKPRNYPEILKLIEKEEFSNAIQKIEKVLKSKKFRKDPDILNHYAYCLRKINNIEKAEIYYIKALNIDPSHRGALEYLGELYVDTKRIDKAKKILIKLKNCRCEEYSELKSYIEK